ncbi:Protein Y53H1B.2 [Aphelenchoides avenae]|nr:Protein Y53H1B.2 [Aphelenchus avenae]KAH7704580.1 Protein Y53H1B.2 [Aphelenchus avenae]
MFSSLRMILAFALLESASGYMFKCLDGCECDTDDELIHCHNNPERERFQMPDKRLRGFTIIGMTQNNIKVLPSEDLLLDKFPDLKAIDIEGNAQFDCSTLPQYRRVKVMSDCDRDSTQEVLFVPTTGEPTEECDFKCQADRHYKSLHEYVLKLWELIKAKWGDVQQNEIVKEVTGFFNDVYQKVKQLEYV